MFICRFPSRFFPLLRVCATLLGATAVPAFFAVAAGNPALGAAAATGSVSGRVLNAASGSFLNNAKVTIDGTLLLTATNEDGEFALAGVPAGKVTLTASFSGMVSQTVELTVAAGSNTRQEFELHLPREGESADAKVVSMESFTVRSTQLTAQAIALQERQNAPNIKAVIAVENDMAEGNVGEFLKTIPGIALDQNPQSPSGALIRGMPASGTLVMTDGAEVASANVTGRAVDLGLAATGNIDRIEVSKVPTPDMPANAVGGSINMISKSAFSRSRPLFTYSAFATATTRDGYRNTGLGNLFGSSHGIDSKSDMPRINPAVNLSYLYPVSKTLGLTFSLSHSTRYTDWDFRRPTWDKVRGIKTAELTNALPFGEKKFLAGAKADWRLGQHQFSASGSFSTQDIFTRQIQTTAAFGTGVTGGPMLSQGAATGVGSATQAFTGNNQDKSLLVLSLSDRYAGRGWNWDGNVSYSKARFKFSDMEGGFFGAVNATISNLVLRQEYINPDDTRVGLTTARTRTGQPIDIYDGNLYTVNSMSTTAQVIDDKVQRAAMNASRDFAHLFPVTLKAGLMVNQRHDDVDGGNNTWTYTPPNGAAGQLASAQNLVDENFSSVPRFKDILGQSIRVQAISSAKLKRLYDEHPDWFVFNPSNAYINKANGTKELEETISAAYLRTDVRRFHNRLWIVAGVRFERTDDSGAGVLNDIRRTFRQDGNGNLLLDAAGRPIKVTADVLENARLQYTIKGSHAKAHYDGWYPSLNTSYTLTPNLVARAAYARTIGRPNFSDIIPGLTITDPSQVAGNRTITAITGKLRPWTADNYDLTLELYEKFGATASVSAFRKSVTGFFQTTRQDATPEGLAALGLTDSYLDYDIVTKRNGGDARIDGVEFEYRQSLLFVPDWARGLQVFGNATHMKLGGTNANDFTGFTKKTGNWGLSFTRPRFSARVAVNYTGLRRLALVAASSTVRPNSYTFYAPQTRIDVSVSYMISKRCTLFADVRNLAGVPLRRGTWSEDTPAYARIDQYQFAGAMFTLGLRGQF
jgi:iron complex outermembrane recepter protein